MAVMFTLEDVNAYKAAMARHAAKNNRLVEKWQRVVDSLKKDIDELQTCKPGFEKDYRLRDKESSLFYVSEFIEDLQLPADAEISDFEWRTCK